MSEPLQTLQQVLLVVVIAGGLVAPSSAQSVTFQQVDVTIAGVQGNGWCTSLLVPGWTW